MNLQHMHTNLDELWMRDNKKYQFEYGSSVLNACLLVKHAIYHNVNNIPMEWKNITLAPEHKPVLIKYIEDLCLSDDVYEQIFNYGLNAIKNIEKFTEYEISQILAYATNINIHSTEQVQAAIEDLNEILGNESDSIIKQLITKDDKAQITTFGFRILNFIQNNSQLVFNSFHIDKYRWREAIISKIIFNRTNDTINLKNIAEEKLEYNTQDYCFISANRETSSLRTRAINNLAREMTSMQDDYEFKLLQNELELKIPNTDIHYAHILQAINLIKPTGEVYLNIRLATWQQDELTTFRKFLTVNKLISKVIYIKTSRRDPWVLISLTKNKNNTMYMLGENFYAVGGLKYTLNKLTANRSVQAVLNNAQINNACGLVEVSAIKEPNYSLDPKTCLNLQTTGANSSNLLGNTVLLSDICEVFRGPGVYNKDVGQMPSDPHYYIIGHSAITDQGLSYKQLTPITQAVYNDFKSFAIYENDLVLLSRSTTNRVAIVPQSENFFLANINVLVLRPNPKYINPQYLLLLLNSPKGRALIGSIEKGVTLKSINIKALKKLQLEIIDLEAQNQIVEKYLEQRKIFDQAQENYNKFILSINDQL